MVAAEGACERRLLGRSDGADDGGTAQLGQLHQQAADAAGGRMHQAGVAGSQLEGRMRQVVRSQALQHQRAGVVEAGVRGHAHQLGLRHDGVLREAAAHDAPGDAVADGDVGDALAHRRHRAGALHAQRHRQRIAVGVRLGVTAEADVHVDEVEASDLDLHQGLARTGLRHGNVVEPALARIAVGLDTNRLHRFKPLPGSLRCAGQQGEHPFHRRQVLAQKGRCGSGRHVAVGQRELVFQVGRVFLAHGEAVE